MWSPHLVGHQRKRLQRRQAGRVCQTSLASSLHALDVVPCPCVDPQQIPLIDEERHVDSSTCLNLSRLRARIRTIPFDPGYCFNNLQLHSDRNLDPHDFCAVEENIHPFTILQELCTGTYGVFGNRDLIVGVLVHEIIPRSVPVEKLEFLPIDPDDINGLSGAKAVFDDFAALEVLQLCTDECAPIARVHMLKLDNSPQLIIVLYCQSGTKIRSRRHRKSENLQ